MTPGELFLASVATCGIELTEVIAREQNLPLQAVRVAISGVLDRSNPVRQDVTLFNSIRLEFLLKGVTEEQGVQLIESFKRRCPLYGTVAVATPDVHVDCHTER